MKNLILLFALLMSLSACSSHDDRKKIARKLGDSAIKITKNYQDTVKFATAIDLLDKAVQFDSTNFSYYKDKYFFEISLRRSKSALKTVGHLLEFRPDSAELHFDAGILQIFNKDTAQAMRSFDTATKLFKAILDTLDKRSPYYFYDWRLWAASMIMVGKGEIIHQFLKENCTTAMDSSVFYAETLSKGKEELLQMMTSQYSR